MKRRRSSSDRRPNINDVAEHAGVSVATVSRALRGFDNVSEQTRLRVEAAARELEYHINRGASRLATGRHESVALVVPRIDTWYFSTVLAGIESVLGQADDLLLWCVDDVATRAQLVAGSAPLRKRVDGLVFVDVLLEDDEAMELDRAGLRVVTIGQRLDRFASVTIDNRGSAREVALHLAAAGHRTVGIVCGANATKLPYTVPIERRTGFVEGWVEAGGSEADIRVVDAEGDLEAGSEAMARLFEFGDSPSAVFAVSDELAFGVLAETRRRGLAVAGDVAVVGFDDHPVASVLELTTVRQDPYEQGRVAAELFVAMSDPSKEQGSPDHRVEATELVIRRSTSA